MDYYALRVVPRSTVFNLIRGSLVMRVQTEIRDSAKAHQSGTVFFPNFDPHIPLVIEKENGDLYYVVDGVTSERALDLDEERALACLPFHQLPNEILHQASAKQIRSGFVILYRKKEKKEV